MSFACSTWRSKNKRRCDASVTFYLPGEIASLPLRLVPSPAFLAELCRDHGVRYLNTSVELWDPYDAMTDTPPLDRTLYVRHMSIRRMIASWPDNRGATAVLEHGANPGLVSHWVKKALVAISQRMLRDGLPTTSPHRQSQSLNTAIPVASLSVTILLMRTARRMRLIRSPLSAASWPSTAPTR